MYFGCIVLRYPMSLISPTSNSSASVALRLLTDAAARQSNPTTGTQLKSLTDTVNSASQKAANPSYDTKIILSLAAAEQAYGSDSFLMQTARGRADEIQITTDTIPSDKAAFKSEVLSFLGTDMKTDPEFMAALKAGKVTVNTVDEVPELKISPIVSFTMYQNGHTTGSGGFSPAGTNQALYDQFSSTRGQAIGSIGNSQFYAYWPKPS
jgi:hypothetical protein